MGLNQCILTPELLLLIISLTNVFIRVCTLLVHKTYKTRCVALVHNIYDKSVGAATRESWLTIAVSSYIRGRLAGE